MVDNEYDRAERVMYGMIPLLGPVYLLGSYLSLRFDKERWAEVKREQRELSDLVKEIKEEFNLVV